ncbi:cyclin-dependent kinase inhibitor 3 family protein [Deinococcus radiomollis]|uniref:cyclin-dependent kinase inhibitor 3 family protein n=1 Tax=Deinococcus radiomollis TaxID=468916 RepID=UPI003892AC33
MTKTLTSEISPIRVDWIETALWPGHLGLTLAPGKKGLSANGETLHDRDLEADLTRLRQHYGTQVLVSLLELDEARRYGLETYDAQAEDLGIDVLYHSIPDADVPQNTATFAEFADEVMNRLLNGETVVAHCLGGLGRAGTLAACLLVQAGMTPQQGMELVRAARPGAIETPAQERFVEAFGE